MKRVEDPEVPLSLDPENDPLAPARLPADLSTEDIVQYAKRVILFKDGLVIEDRPVLNRTLVTGMVSKQAGEMG